MELPQSLINRFKLTDLTTKAVVRLNERSALIQEMLEIINQERIGTKYKPLTGRGLAIKISHIPTQDLYATHSMAKDYKVRKGSYSKYLFGAIKVCTEYIKKT